MKKSLNRVEGMIVTMQQIRDRLEKKQHSPALRTAYRQTLTCLDELEWMVLALQDVIEKGNQNETNPS